MNDVLVDLEDGVLRITLNRPDRLNAVDADMLSAISDALADADGVRVAVLTGEGRAFCSGAVTTEDVDARNVLDGISRLITTIMDAPFPVVAAVNGVAAGVGCSVAVACDVSIAASSGYVLQAFVNIGLMPDGAATALLAASIGRTRAMRLMLTGEKLPADEAVELGLLTYAVPDEEFEQFVQATIQRLAGGPTLAYAKTKAAVNAATVPLLAEILEREVAGQIELSSTADHAEGRTAFVEKRSARFTGR